jgi:hypothetical protein
VINEQLIKVNVKLLWHGHFKHQNVAFTLRVVWASVMSNMKYNLWKETHFMKQKKLADERLFE